MKNLLHLKQKGLHINAVLVKGISANLFVRTFIDDLFYLSSLCHLCHWQGFAPCMNNLYRLSPLWNYIGYHRIMFKVSHF